MQVKYRHFAGCVFFSLKFVGIVFVSLLYDLASASASTISPHLITESSIIFAKY